MLLLHLSHRIKDRESYFSLMKRVKAQSTFIVLAITLLWISNVSAATINATSCSQAHVQAAVNSASDGDIVSIPSGTCAWTTAVGWTDKNISVVGAGIGNTVITGDGSRFSIKANTKASFRVSGMTFSGNTGDSILVQNDLAAPTKGWRIDNIRFHYSSTSSTSHAVGIKGITWGVIDNCIFDGSANYVAIYAYGYAQNDPVDQYGKASWDLPLNLGSDEAIYVENCQFDFSSNLPFVNDLWYGARMVIRHNTMIKGIIQTHSARANARGGLKLEVYNNTFTGNGFLRPSHIRSGTGVIFNNTVTGYQNNNFVIDNQRTCSAFSTRCNGNDTTRDGNTPGEYGWPCLDQIGRGSGTALKVQPSVPLYAWNNGSSVIVLNGDFDLSTSGPPYLSTHLKTKGDTPAHAGGVLDYVNNGTTPKPGYTPYTYPHPLRQTEPSGKPQSPDAFRIAASQEELSLSVTTSGNGSVDVVPNQGTYSFGQQVTLTAMADPGWVFSGWSGDLAGNDNPVTLTISGDHQVTATFADSALTYSEGFEAYNDGGDPVDWLDTAANNNMSKDNSLFQVVDVGGEKVFGTASTLTNIHSHYTGSGSTVFSNYEYTARMMMTVSSGGIGVTFLSQYPVRDAYYRLRHHKSDSFHIAPHGTSVFGITDTGVVPIANNWYRFRVRVQDTGIRTEILAKVWLDGDVEPIDWQVNAYDDTDNRLTSGTFGVWSFMIGSKYWDDLMVIPFSP
ncbi:MAG: hypothetical protein C4B58_13905 [Deltaproteobacteria bacterium]|nr:MAG: hypothetical protein C4B58_13905 [Deltaproteobacteria bacterium]